MNKQITGSILTPGGWVAGELHYDATILRTTGTPTTSPIAPFVVPGFIDCHVHGGGGEDMMNGVESITTAARLHARHGTTSLCPTSVTAPEQEIIVFLDAVASVMANAPVGAARILGAHLEGPFINPEKLGAQPPHALAADATRLAEWAARARIRLMTFAPEVDPEGALLAALSHYDIRAQLGHSLCDYATARVAISAGCGVTHLFNAMSGISHRGNGLCGAALAHANYAEIIPDLIHVEAGAILAARRAIPGLYGVTDATAGAGMADGIYRLGSHHVIKSEGAMRLADGTLAGSALTMDTALRNFVSVGLPLEEAARRLSTVPADWLGMNEIGRLETGACADINVLDADLTLQRVVIGGVDVNLQE